MGILIAQGVVTHEYSKELTLDEVNFLFDSYLREKAIRRADFVNDIYSAMAPLSMGATEKSLDNLREHLKELGKIING